MSAPKIAILERIWAKARHPERSSPVSPSKIGDRKREIRDAFEPILGIRHEREGIRSSADLVSVIADFTSALANLGPVFSHLARYLGSRPDCFPPSHCLILGETDETWLLSGAELQPYFEEWLGADEVPPWLANLKSDRERSDHLTHCYRWRDQPDLAFRLLNPKFVELWATDRELLKLIVKPAQVIWPQAPVDRLVRQFKEDIERALDPERQADWIKSYPAPETTLPAPGVGFLRPELAEEFCRPGIVATRDPAQASLLNPFQKKEKPRTGTTAARPDEIEIGRRFCLSILRQLTRGAWFPRSPSPENVGVTKQQRLMLFGGSAETLESEVQERLFNYFAAVAGNRPDDASEILLTLFDPERGALPFGEVRDLFRQIVPFRDGGMGDPTMSESFSDQVFIQWRLATESGYSAPAELVPVIQCFWRATSIARNIDPSLDLFRESYYEFRWTEAIASIQKVVTAGNIAGQGLDWLQLMMEIPQFLNAMAKKRSPVEPAVSESPRTASSRSPAQLWISVAAHVFVMASIGMLLVNLAEVRPDGMTWLYLGFGAFAAVGFSLLNAVRRKN